MAPQRLGWLHWPPQPTMITSDTSYHRHQHCHHCHHQPVSVSLYILWIYLQAEIHWDLHNFKKFSNLTVFCHTWQGSQLSLALFDMRLFKKMNNFFEWINQHYFEWIIFWIWITFPGKKWIFFWMNTLPKKMNELLNEWKQCVIHRKNEYNVKKKDVKFDIKGPTEYEKQRKMQKRACHVEKIYKGLARGPILGR